MQQAAATKIQATYRGHKTRQGMQLEKEKQVTST